MEQWENNLRESERDFMKSIIDQVPEAMGARAAFVGILNAISTPPKVKPKKDDFPDDYEV